MKNNEQLWRVRMRDLLTDEVTFEYVTARGLVDAVRVTSLTASEHDTRVPVGFTLMVEELV